MQNFLERIHRLAKKNPKRILFAEGTEPRVIEAAKLIEKEGLAKTILLKPPFINLKFYATKLSKLRDITLEEALESIKNPHILATLMLHNGEADAMIAGPTAPSRERILPAFQIIKTKKKFHKVSGFFFMILPENVDKDAANGGVLLFADCAVNINPTSEELAEIAIDTAETAKNFGISPKIAMLSFSTAGSSNDPAVHKVRHATELIKILRPDLPVEGEIQVDAALMDDVAAQKIPGSSIAGHANVLIFPDLEAGNIAYKLVERLAGAKAIGPILQGLNKPVNELSRGCSIEDIVNLAAITSVEPNHLPNL